MLAELNAMQLLLCLSSKTSKKEKFLWDFTESISTKKRESSNGALNLSSISDYLLSIARISTNFYLYNFINEFKIMDKIPRETLVQYQQAIETILAESNIGKNKSSNYDSRLAIDCISRNS